MQILGFKQPSFIKKVDYKKLIEELYETKIADDSQQDTYIKKLVATSILGSSRSASTASPWATSS